MSPDVSTTGDPARDAAGTPTRERILEAAFAAFAEHGYAGGSVRTIVRAARTNQGAINYHFGSKEGLYREVLRLAAAELGGQPALDAGRIAELGREVALHLFLRGQFGPLLRRAGAARALRLMAWENLAPTETFRAHLREEPAPVLASARALARAFLPADAAAAEVAVATVWLVHQPAIFVRNAALLAEPPFDLPLGEGADAGAVERLVDVVARLVLAGLAGAGPRIERPGRQAGESSAPHRPARAGPPRARDTGSPVGAR